MRHPPAKQSILLALHFWLLSVPRVLFSFYFAFLMTWGALLRGSVVFLSMIALWALLSLLALSFIYRLINAWHERGTAGLRENSEPLSAMGLICAMQAGCAMYIVVGPFGMLFLPVSIALGAPWLTLVCHLRWLTKKEVVE